MRNFRGIKITLLIFVIALSARARGLTNIRRVDFNNLSFPWDDDLATAPSDLATPWHWIDSLLQSRIRVVNGVHRFYKPNQSRLEREHSPLIRLNSVTFGDLDGDGEEEAAVHLNYSTGGTMNWDYLYVYKFVRGGPRLMGILQSGSRGYGGLVRTSIQDGMLVLDFADPERPAGDCCSEGYIRVHYRWRNRAFVEEGPRERGDQDLNSH
jgi:hypothetical protein